MQTEGRLLVTVPEAAERLTISERQVYRLMQSGELRAVKIGRACRIPVTMLQAYLAQLMSDAEAKL